MATVVLQSPAVLRSQSRTPPPLLSVRPINTSRSSTPVPNKHIPYCPPGPAPSSQPPTPPNSPPQKTFTVGSTSLLYPPHSYPRLLKSPSVYGLDHSELAQAFHHAAGLPLPCPTTVFPWLHGLHPNNYTQLSFFVARKKSLRKIPKDIRAITIIKAGGDLTFSRIKGAVAPDEVLDFEDGKGFLDCDPPEGFSVRNFHIQAAKIAQVSDIIVYGDSKTDYGMVRSVAERAASVQRAWRKDLESSGQAPNHYHTFVLTSSFEELEQAHPELIAVGSSGKSSVETIDFLQQERLEMWTMTKASEISHGVQQGPSPSSYMTAEALENYAFDVLVECNDHATMPDAKVLAFKSKQLQNRTNDEPVYVSFPSSGSIMPTSAAHSEVDGLLKMCQWIHDLTHVPQPTSCIPDKDGDIPMTDLTQRTKRVLIHCPDGYTESSLLSVAYYMFAEGVPLHEAWIKLHRDQSRNFFAYPSDVAFLKSMQSRILKASPRWSKAEKTSAPQWLSKMDGSLPSRILPYMYLGNLTHANNPEMLKELGIKRILSVGEPVSWSKSQWEAWGRDNVTFVDRVQDNGIDELGVEIERCLEFIARGKADGTATLVHCRVGVSRSATICIAEVMASQSMPFSRAYCFVRARRLNVIIQPHLRFVYELMKWDEIQQERRGQKIKRDMDWASVAREIAAMNRPYSRT